MAQTHSCLKAPSGCNAYVDIVSSLHIPLLSMSWYSLFCLIGRLAITFETNVEHLTFNTSAFTRRGRNLHMRGNPRRKRHAKYMGSVEHFSSLSVYDATVIAFHVGHDANVAFWNTTLHILVQSFNVCWNPFHDVHNFAPLQGRPFYT